MQLKLFFDHVLSVKEEHSTSFPLLQNLAVLGVLRSGSGPEQITHVKPGIIERKIDRHYRRLCRVQEELGQLNMKQAAAKNLPVEGTPGISFEDYVFSQIDFSRCRQMAAGDFERIFPESLTDFDEDFFVKNFRISRNETRVLIEKSYKKENALYKIQGESPLLLSVMRTLETSLENNELFTVAEIQAELESFINLTSQSDKKSLSGKSDFPGLLSESDENGKMHPDTKQLFPLLVSSLDGLNITHHDGMKTKLFVSSGPGDSPKNLSATFMPGNKAWTRVLISG